MVVDNSLSKRDLPRLGCNRARARFPFCVSFKNIKIKSHRPVFAAENQTARCERGAARETERKRASKLLFSFLIRRDGEPEGEAAAAASAWQKSPAACRPRPAPLASSSLAPRIQSLILETAWERKGRNEGAAEVERRQIVVADWRAEA